LMGMGQRLQQLQSLYATDNLTYDPRHGDQEHTHDTKK
jgi:hypothetical protein